MTDPKRQTSRAWQVAAFLGWPDGSVEVVERVMARHPGWQVGWRPELDERPARFYAARQEGGALPVLVYGQDEAELVAAIEARMPSLPSASRPDPAARTVIGLTLARGLATAAEPAHLVTLCWMIGRVGLSDIPPPGPASLGRR